MLRFNGVLARCGFRFDDSTKEIHSETRIGIFGPNQAIKLIAKNQQKSGDSTRTTGALALAFEMCDGPLELLPERLTSQPSSAVQLSLSAKVAVMEQPRSSCQSL